MCRIAVIGLGYVGFPLACAFGEKERVIGIDIDSERVAQLKENIRENLGLSDSLYLYDDYRFIQKCEFIIVTVPTPVDQNNKPDLYYLEEACQQIGIHMSPNTTVVFESTVYPGCTEDVCVPILERYSGCKLNRDLFVAYSPERINPGDTVHTLENVVKVVGASDETTLLKTEALYQSIVQAGIYKVSSIKIAEAAKVIENAQRDLNISFVNELALIFDRMNIDTQEVLDAAGTKWNFLPFRPGLVGGHCISVDPYYLAFKSEELGYVPEVLLSGRKVNNYMGKFVAQKVVKLMSSRNVFLKEAQVLVLGFSFKENWPDVRNTKVWDLVRELMEYGIDVDVFDPVADFTTVERIYPALSLRTEKERLGKYNAIILAVAHDVFIDLDLEKLKRDDCILYDIKSFWSKDSVSGRL
ncbi:MULTISPECIES: nucleotide sugar dehydrogenase [Chitinophagaceae]